MNFFGRTIFSGSLVYRIGAAAAGLAIAVTTALGTAFYVELRRTIADELAIAVATDASIAVKEAEDLVESVDATLHGLAANSLVGNSLVDSLGRDTYLVPYLKGLSQMIRIEGNVVLTDFAGKPIASSSDTATERVDPTWVRDVVDSAKPRVAIMPLAGEICLVLANPVIYPHTGQAEGALVLAVPLRFIARAVDPSHMEGVSHFLAADRIGRAWQLGNGNEVAQPVAAELRPLPLNGPLSTIGLRVASVFDAGLINRPLERLTIGFAFAGLLLVAVVALVAAELARRIVTPIRRLEKEASSFDFSRSQPELLPGDFADDEIGRLAVAFRSMEERLLKAYEEVGAVNKELEAFSYSVSHDLRTPLRAIDGFSEMLMEDYHDRLDDEAKRRLTVVRANAVRMGQLIDDILGFSRMGRREMQEAEIDIGKLAGEAFTEVQPATAGRAAQLDIRTSPPAYGDRSMLRQVLVNLLSNAVKFSRSRPVASIEVGGTTQGAENVYYVRDNGVGFDMQYVQKLFGVFERLHSNKQFEGTGIGLAIVKRVVQRHGGRVWAESQPDQGATFYFSLPRKGKSPCRVT